MTAARAVQSLEGDWRAAAACLDEPRPDVFFPVGADAALAEPAKAYCRRCPVVRPCLSEAITHDVAGVWGGTTETERDVLRQRFGVTARPIRSDLPIDNPAALAIHMTGGGVLGSGDRRPAPHDTSNHPALPTNPPRTER